MKQESLSRNPVPSASKICHIASNNSNTLTSYSVITEAFASFSLYIFSAFASVKYSASQPSPFIFYKFLTLSISAIRASFLKSSPFSSTIGLPAILSSTRFVRTSRDFKSAN